MTWQDVAKIIAGIAPEAGAIVGGPLGAAAGGAIKLLAGAFGISGDPSPDQVAAAIQADPQAALKIRLAAMQYQHEETMAKIADLEKQREDDRLEMANARGRQIEHEKATGKSDWNLYLLAWLFVGGFFSTLILYTALIFTGQVKEIPSTALYLLGNLNGTLTAGVGAVIQYFFGKTKDSAAHVEALTNSIPLEQMQKFLNMVTSAGNK